MFSLMPPRRDRREGRPLTLREHTPFDLLRREFGPLFDRFFSAWPVPLEAFATEMEPWGLEMEEMDREFVVRAEVPGFEPNELEVLLTGDVLTIRAEHADRAKPKEKEPVEHRHERWERSLTLPAGIVPESMEARCKNGVLEVHVPKAPGVAPRRIEVKS